MYNFSGDDLNKDIEQNKELLQSTKDALYANRRRQSLIETAISKTNDMLKISDYDEELKELKSRELRLAEMIKKTEDLLQQLKVNSYFYCFELTKLDNREQYRSLRAVLSRANRFVFVTLNHTPRCYATLLFLQRILLDILPPKRQPKLEVQVLYLHPTALEQALTESTSTDVWWDCLMNELGRRDRVQARRELIKRFDEDSLVLVCAPKQDNLIIQQGVLQFWQEVEQVLKEHVTTTRDTKPNRFLLFYLTSHDVTLFDSFVSLNNFHCSYSEDDLLRWFEDRRSFLPDELEDLEELMILERFLVPEERNLNLVLERLCTALGDDIHTMLSVSPVVRRLYQR